MRNFQNNFETFKQSFISAFSICMTVPLKSDSHLPKKTFLFASMIALKN